MNATPSLLDQQMARSRYFFRIVGIPDDTFGVAAFEIENHTLSGNYRIHLILHSEAVIDGRLMVHRPAVLSLEWPGGPQWFHGRVTLCRRVESVGDRVGYRVCIESPLAGAARRRSYRVFRNNTVQDLAAEVLAVADPAPIPIQWRLQRPLPKRPYTVQWAESDLAFLTRHMSDAGIFFGWHQTETEALLIFSDDATAPATGEAIELHFAAQTGTHRLQDSIHRWHPSARLATDAIRIIDYYDQTPEKDVQGKKESRVKYSRIGIRDEIVADTPTPETALSKAESRMAASEGCNETIIARSDCMAAAPGKRCIVAGHPDPKINGEYLITRVDHSGDQRSGQAPGASPKGPVYHNRMVLVPAAVPFVSVPDSAPTLNSAVSGTIETAGGTEAHLDDQGRYRLRLHLDRGDAAPATASEPVRLMQPYGGNQFGSHMPLHGDTEAMVIHTHDHPDRPLIMGTVTSPNTPNPVTSVNRTTHRLHTDGRNTLCLEDGPDEHRIHVNTSDEANRLTLATSDNGDRIALATNAGDMALAAGGAIRSQTGASQSMSIGGRQAIHAANHQHLTTRSGDSAVHSATAAHFHSKAHCQWAAIDGRHGLVAAQHIHSTTEGTWSARAVTDPLMCGSDQDNLSISAARDIGIVGTGGGPVRIAQSGGGMEISVDGALTCGGPSTTITAATINIYTGGVGNN